MNRFSSGWPPGAHTTVETVLTNTKYTCFLLFCSPLFCPSSTLLSCSLARTKIRNASVDLERGTPMWSRSFCQRISRHFRSHKLFLLQKARRLESQKACYGGILYVFSPQVYSLLVNALVLCQMTPCVAWRGIPIVSNPPTIQISFLCTAGVFHRNLSFIGTFIATNTSSSHFFLSRTWNKRARPLSRQHRARLHWREIGWSASRTWSIDTCVHASTLDTGQTVACRLLGLKTEHAFIWTVT